MGTKLSQVYENTDYFWVWCDIEGDGDKWYMCRMGKEEWDEDDVVLEFLGKDFSDSPDNYFDCPCSPVLTPKRPEAA